LKLKSAETARAEKSIYLVLITGKKCSALKICRL